MLPKYSENWVGEGEMRSAGETPSGAKAALSESGNTEESGMVKEGSFILDEEKAVV